MGNNETKQFEDILDESDDAAPKRTIPVNKDAVKAVEIDSRREGEIVRMSRSLSAGEIELLLDEAGTELKALVSAEEIKAWWRKYYLKVGHKKLGRVLIGKPPKKEFQKKP